MEFLINNIDDIKDIIFSRSNFDKNRTDAKVNAQKNNSDKVELSEDIYTFRKQVEESANYLEKLKESRAESEEKIQQYQEKVKENSYNLDEVNNKIVYSLLTLPAFNRLHMTRASNSETEVENAAKYSKMNHELEELKKIQEELDEGDHMDKVLEEAIQYLMKSLIS